MKVMLPIYNVMPTRISCLNHWTATLGSTTRIVGASVMCMQHSSNTQWRLLRAYTPGTVATEFMNAEGYRPRETHRCLRSMCGEDDKDISSVRCWEHHFNSGGMYDGNRPHSDPSHTAAIMETTDRVDVIILNNCCITAREQQAATGIGKMAVMDIREVREQKSLCKIGAENCHHQAQTSTMKHLRRTSPVQ